MVYSLIQGLGCSYTYILTLRSLLLFSATEWWFFPARQLAARAPPSRLCAQDRSQNTLEPGRRQHVKLRRHKVRIYVDKCLMIWLLTAHPQQHYTDTEVGLKSLIQTVDPCAEWRLDCTDLSFTRVFWGRRGVILRWQTHAFQGVLVKGANPVEKKRKEK